MIIREWRGRAALDRPAAYPAHFEKSVLPELKTIPGFLGATLMQEKRADRIEFVVLTRWQSMQAIAAFAGSDPSQAVVEPAAVAALVDYDRTVRHYEVVASA
jgi:heme-degrading monooxygenase HmoA